MLHLQVHQGTRGVGVLIVSEAARLSPFARDFRDMDTAQSFMRIALTIVARRRSKLLDFGRLYFTASEQRELHRELNDLSQSMGGQLVPETKETRNDVRGH